MILEGVPYDLECLLDLFFNLLGIRDGAAPGVLGGAIMACYWCL